jgi:hypothetical protein
LKDPSNVKLDDKAILAAHRDWESDYISKTLGRELKIESEFLKLPGGQDAISWSYKMPKVMDAQTAKVQLYLAVVKRDHVLLMNTALEDESGWRDAKNYLMQTMLTLKPSDKPLSLQTASENLRRDNH